MKIEITTRIDDVIAAFDDGKLVIFSTDTLYAVSCDATNFNAVENLYDLKKRDKNKKLPIFFHNIGSVKQYCEVDKKSEKFAKKFWPGKLTMILKLNKNSNIAANIYAPINNLIAVRIPDDEEILELLQKYNKPIIGTSANISGSENVFTYDEICQQFENYNTKNTLYWDKKTPNMTSRQSTIIQISDGDVKIIRDGAIPSDYIMSFWGNFR